MPHPVYGWMGWMCILDPSEASFASAGPLIREAHHKALASARAKLEKTAC